MGNDRPPLAGIKVIDFTHIAAGPWAASLMGDLGADVVKVEPLAGESFRVIDNIFDHGESAYFYGVNRSKRSLAVEFRTPAGREVLRRLVAWADVALVAFRPEAVTAMGLGYDDFKAINDTIVYCSLTAWGDDGPRSHLPGMDLLAQAIGGTMGLTGEPGRPPVKVGPPIADFVGSYLVGFSVCAALLARDRDGAGQRVSVSLLDGQVASIANYVAPYLRTRKPIRPVGGGHPQLVPYQVFESRDGHFIAAAFNNKFWQLLTAAVGRDDLTHDPRFDTNEHRVANRDALIGDLQAMFVTKDSAHWLERLEASGVPCGPVNRLEDTVADPQVRHNDMIVELEHPRYGPYETVGTPMKFSRTPAAPRRHAPSLGEHSLEVLSELGFTPGEAGALVADGIIGLPAWAAPGQQQEAVNG
jgi:crotonobetainyl-CoA:carnitine CoA-transferase CaiB-like acyl-CoA transferase